MFHDLHTAATANTYPTTAISRNYNVDTLLYYVLIDQLEIAHC
jgi:hypothetical protein